MTDEKAMQLTAFARLEQFRIDIEKLMAEKTSSEMQDSHEPQSEEPNMAAPEDYPSGTAQDSAIEIVGKNLFKSLDDALAVLN